ncbi:hypothetical protein SAMD00019534_113560 [Acytostelium subglobosum LB1]|uniref:hypothetical protein n=1 Tax=Acytostelium subglobosum LB1 TaxID=1410327 RepID=UPI000644C5DF|nr:hypothetical protein SAMD00019534_113560 [Acytostelium subglobosum LB1]GAM28180.1 hypothetical protein SAMD00019534_113560 [Acytostelium subglobosum LB1]|eukprot:XP_012748814.1 hypothetical protein SAMD00019534_113560 [Acytostelium subglobosum LB1]
MNYPVNDVLLLSSIQYNNEVAFKHLINNTNMSLSPVDEDQNHHPYIFGLIIRTGSIPMLEAFIQMTGHRTLPNISELALLEAMDKGDEQFVRLILQYTSSVDIEEFDPQYDVGKVEADMTRPGISVNVLRVIHEEYNIDHKYIQVWKQALRYSVNHNIVESVRYIIEHESLRNVVGGTSKMLVSCCELGHLESLQTIMAHMPVPKKFWSYGNPAKLAAENGHANILRYLAQHHLDEVNINNELLSTALLNGHLNVANVILDELTNIPIQEISVLGINWRLISDQLINRLAKHPRVNLAHQSEYQPEAKMSDYDSTQHRFSWAIRNNDLPTANAVIDHCRRNEFKLDSDISFWCKYMSLEMGMLIASLSSDLFYKLRHEELARIIESIGKPDSCLTEQVVDKLIANKMVQMESNDEEESSRILDLAAGVSLSLMKLVKRSLETPRYNAGCLLQAIKQGCNDSIIYLAKAKGVNQGLNIVQDILKGIETCSLETAKAIITHYPLSITKCITSSVSNPNLAVFEYLLDYKSTNHTSQHLKEFVIRAMHRDKPQILRLLMEKKEVEICLEHIEEAAKHNSFNMLEYLLVTWTASPFSANRMTPSHRLRTVNTALNHGYINGFTRVIHLCTSIINEINSNKKRKQPDDHSQSEEEFNKMEVTTPSSSRMTLAFHMVFRDRRLGMIIMGMISEISKTVGIKDQWRISGRALLEIDTLKEYIKFGATEWFIKSFNSISSIYPFNTRLLMSAITHAQSSILNVLLNNTNMTMIDYKDNTRSLLSTLISTAQHSHPASWDQSFDTLRSITCRQKIPLVADNLLTLISNPAFLLKLLSSIQLIGHSIRSCPQYVDMKDPNALELTKIFRDHGLLNHHQLSIVLQKAVLHNNTQLIEYLIDIEGRYSDGLLGYCGDHNLKLLDWVLDNLRTRTEDVLNGYYDVVERGQLQTAKRIYEFTAKHIVEEIDKMGLYKTADDPLRDGHLELACYILGLPYVERSEEDREDDEFCIREVHQSILSVDLLEKVMAHPELRCTFDYVLASAILTGKKDVIDMMMANKTGVFQNNYHYALGAAATVGNVDIATIIIDKHYHHCFPIQYLNKDGKFDNYDKNSDGDRYSNDDTKESINNWSRIHPDVAQVIVQQFGTYRLPVSYDRLKLIIGSLGVKNSQTTQEFVRAAVKGWLANRQENNYKDNVELLKYAAQQSFQTFEMVDQELEHELSAKGVCAVIRIFESKNDVEAIQYVLDYANDERGRMLDIFPYIRDDPNWLKSPDVLAILLEYDAIPENRSQSTMVKLMDVACENGRLDMIQYIDQRFNNNNIMEKKRYLIVPSVYSMIVAAGLNHHQVLNYLFCDEHSSYCKVMIKHPTHFIRVLKRVQYQAFIRGNMKVIRMTAERINHLLNITI